MYHFNFYSYSLLISALISVTVGIHLLKKNKVRAAYYLAVTEFAASIWALGCFFESGSMTVRLKFIWSVIAYIGTISIPIFFFFFIYFYVYPDRHIKKNLIILISIIPIITMFLAITNPYHSLIWPRITIDPILNIATYEHGLWFWIFVISSWGYLIAGEILLLYAFNKFSSYYRKYFLTIIICTLFPLLSNIKYLLKIDFLLPNVDWTPASFAIFGIMLTITIFNNKIFDIIPIAKNRIFETLEDFIFVVDKNLVIIDANIPAQKQLALTNNGIGRKLDLVFIETYPKLYNFLISENEIIKHAEREIDGKNQYFDFKKFSIKDSSNFIAGYVVIVHDITSSVLLQQEKQQLALENKYAKDKIRTLSELLPICANCKKIRDDEGYWQNVENYISEHTGTQFSHGICPDCMKEIYPDIYNKIKEEGKV